MSITVTMHDTATLLGVQSKFAEVPSYFLDLFFGGQINFDTEYVDFEKVSTVRKLAPLVVPHAQGRPMYSEKSTVTRIKPAYIKPKDPVSPSRVIRRRPGSLATPNESDPAARFDALVADILREQREGIERRLEWMAAEAILYGQVVLEDDDYPKATVDFQRDADLTIDLTGGDEWTSSSGIVKDINDWRSLVRRKPFGGPTNRLTVTPSVWDVMSINTGLVAQLDTTVRGTRDTLNTGVREGLQVEKMGTIGGNLEIWLYSDYYELQDGTAVPFMQDGDVLLSGPNVQGTRCYGAILDLDAGLRSLPLFPKMWKNQDPSVLYIMTQSAPLMVPVNPNNTLRATVLTPPSA